MIVALVPAFNEAKQIGSVVRSLFNHVDKVVVIDDASSDETMIEAREVGAIVLRHELNRGQGAALQTGHDYALEIGADYVVHFDGDGQFDAADIKPALEKLKQVKADVLFGSRFLDRRSRIPCLKRYIILPLGRIFNRCFWQLKLSDAHNGFRILNRRALEKIKISQERMAHATEIPALAKKYNLRYIEFPVKVTYHKYGQGMHTGLGVVKDLFLAKFLR